MGLFDIFKKKEEPKRQNTINSVYTLKFTIPYFSIFDKTDKSLEAFPIKLAIGGSVQYRITEPDLCFDNVPLGEMSPSQLETHVKDRLISTIKSFISNIDTIPILQFETSLEQINDAAKIKLLPIFDEEFGVSLRAFNITRFTYDEEDPNFIHLKSCGTAALERKEKTTVHKADRDLRHEDEDIEEERERRRRKRAMLDRFDEEDILEERTRARRQRELVDKFDEEDVLEERQRSKRLRRLLDDEELYDRESRLQTSKQQTELHLRRTQHNQEKELEEDAIDLERKRRELNEDMHARRTAIDSGAKLSELLANRKKTDLNANQTTSQSISEKKDDGLDLGAL